MSTNETAAQLLDSAQLLIQQRGYNAFSYKDLAASVGIRTASIHYHFPAKADLGHALMERYVTNLEGVLATIDAGTSTSKSKLKSFIKLYTQTESSGSICLCGSLASDAETLPPPMQKSIETFVAMSERWIAQTIAAGVVSGEFAYAGKPADAATALLASLQGGLILSRARDGRPLVLTMQRVFLQMLEA